MGVGKKVKKELRKTHFFSRSEYMKALYKAKNRRTKLGEG